MVAVPLVVRGKALGSLTSYYPAAPAPDEDEIAFLRTAADLAAVAVENARLINEAQVKAALEERQRLARELHDSVSQALYGIVLGASTARSLLDADPQKAAEPLDYALSLAEAGMVEMRALIFELRPESLATEGLVAALEKQAASLRARYGLDVRAELPAEPEAPLETKEALYRIAQEALHNVVKHAQARTVTLCLTRDGDDLVLEVADDGQGFEAGREFPGHIGQHSMRERAAQVGGDVELASAPGQGTRVTARVPIAERPAQA
jgi:signal transduction histidine kinase